MGLFGKKRPAVLDYTSAVNPAPNPMRDPMASLGGYDQQAAMQGKSGFAPMNQGFTPPEQKKPGFFSKGGAWLDVLGAFGDGFGTNGPVYAQSKMQRNKLMQEQQMAEKQRQQMAEQQRMQEREDKQWEWANKPKEERAPYRWESNDGSLMEIGPDGAPRAVYKDPTPKTTYITVDNGNNTKTIVPVVNGVPLMGGAEPQPQAPVGKLRPIGGGGSNVTGGFRPRL